MIAPTERSMPAVRITSVCAAPTMPMIATCCRISVSVKGEKNLPPSSDAEDRDRRRAARSAAPATGSDAGGAGTAARRTCASSNSATAFGLPCDSRLRSPVVAALPVFARHVAIPSRCGPGAASPRARRQSFCPQDVAVDQAGGSAPAELGALGRCRSTRRPSTGLSVTSATPVSKKSLPGVGCGLRAVVGPVRRSPRCPSEAISSGYCCEVAPITPSLTFCDARAAAVDRDDQHVASRARSPSAPRRRRRRRVR